MDLDYEIWLRLAAFLAVFAVLAIAHVRAAARLTLSRRQRWSTNLGSSRSTACWCGPCRAQRAACRRRGGGVASCTASVC